MINHLVPHSVKQYVLSFWFRKWGMNPFLCWLNLIGQKNHPLGMTKSFSQLQSEAVERHTSKLNFSLPKTSFFQWLIHVFGVQLSEEAIFIIKRNQFLSWKWMLIHAKAISCILGHSFVGGSVRSLVALTKRKAASFLQRYRFCLSLSLPLSFSPSCSLFHTQTHSLHRDLGYFFYITFKN